MRKRGLEQFSNDFPTSADGGLQDENVGIENTQRGLNEEVAPSSSMVIRPDEEQVRSQQNTSKSAKFTQGLHKDYTSPDDCNHPNDATLPDDLLDVIEAWPMLSTQVKDCIHALATTAAKDT